MNQSPLTLLAVTFIFSLHCAARADQPAKDEEPNFYTPVETQVEGWTVRVDPQLQEADNKPLGDRALVALANHLQRIQYIVPEERVEQLRKLPIWLELHNKKLGSMQYHPSRAWLKKNGHDPRLAKHVHIPRAADLLSRRTWAKHPYVVLHELAHAYHDQVLSFEHPHVLEAYGQAKKRKLYDEVLLFTGKKVRHYALTNHKEFFAEMTEAYFGVNDFFPFVRAELRLHDEVTFQMLQAIWGKVPN